MGVLLVLGVLAFFFFFFSDWNDWKAGSPALRVLFPVGAGLLAAVTVLQTVLGPAFADGVWRWLLLTGAAGFTWLMADALFFALPRKEAYGEPGRQREAQTGGVYALCRHPGVLWFLGLYACLWPLGLPLRAAVIYSLLNLLLAAFEDALVFPTRLEGYADYRRTTPFLIPNGRSLRAARRKK